MFVRTILVILIWCLAVAGSLSAQTGQLLYPPHKSVDGEISATYDAGNECTAGCDLICGDIDGDGTVNPLDVVFFVSYLWNDGAVPEPINVADVNGSGVVNGMDVVYFVSYLWNDGPAPQGCAPSISIVGLEPNDDTVNGTASVSDTSKTKVVLWAKTDRWYVQPTIAEPYTIIQSDGTWSNFTHPWDRIVALLVDSSYVPGSTRDYHPSVDPGVLCWDEYPDESLRYISWSGYCWTVKIADLVDPGPNYFSDDTVNVMIDQEDRLHLKIDFRNNKWYCAEVVLDHSLGYGLYTFQLDSRVDSLDYNAIFAGFIYETINQEFDIEFSQRLADPFNAQYVAQPWYIPGNMEFFDMSSSSQTSHSFEWRPDRIVFTSWNGHSDVPTSSTLIHTWTYTGGNIPVPGGERMIFNLYLYGGEPPIQGTEDEVTVSSFRYTDQ